MALKDLLVHVGTSKSAEMTVDAALLLAEANDAHLVGLGIEYPPDVPLYYGEAALPQAFLDELAENEAKRVKAAEKMFRTKVRQAGREERSEWRTEPGLPTQILAFHARYADLTILRQSDPETSDQRYPDVPGDLLLSTGRPLLVVPAAGAGKTIGKRAILAWNGSREAARAVGDAIPLLERADSVEVFVAGSEPAGEMPGADIAAHLARHGITVEVYRSSVTDADVGEALLNRASELGADLIVMGGYGHSRLRQLILGGVTRHVLENMPVPVLMSH